MRTLSATLLTVLLLPAAAAPIQITGRVLHPPKDVQVELRPWAVEHAEALRRLKGETVPPIASARPRADGSFALQVPDSGFYSVVVRAEGHVAMERFVRFVVEETEVPPVELVRASPLEVKAVGEDGQALAGVTIQAIPLDPESGDWRAAERRAVTDAEGRAVFPRAAGEALTLFVTTPGRYATASTGPAGASQTVRFPAQRFRTVEIRNPDGRPASGALVRLVRRGWPYGLAGEDGRIALPDPLKEEIGFFAEDSRGLRAEIGGEPAATLRPPALAAGRVLDASSREPVAGALVWNGGISWVRTGPGGTFEVRAPSGERGRIEASAAGRMVHVAAWERDRNAAVTFLLEPAAPISGQVVDGEGRPVEGARITTLANPADGSSVPMERRSTSSGPDGRFLLAKLPAGRLHAVEAAREGFAPARRLADSKAPVRLVLRRGMAAAGRVVDEEGLPVAGARVTLAHEDVDGAPFAYKPFEAASDSEGRFRFQHVSAGRFQLRAESAGFAARVVDGVLVPEQEPEVDLGEVRLPAGGAIEGIVTDARGKPVENASIRLSPSDYQELMMVSGGMHFSHGMPETGPDGRFRIESLPRGLRFDLEVGHRQLLPAEAPGVEVPTAQPLRIRLDAPRSLSGRVVDELGDPIAGASVRPSMTIEAADGSRHFRSREQATTDPEGRFALSRVSPGAVDLQVSAAGYRSRKLPQVPIPEDREAEPVEIVLEAGTSLEGRVLDGEDRPVRHVRVQVRRPGEPGLGPSGMADEEGRYEVVDLEPGPCEVEALFLERGGSVRQAVEIRPGRNRLDLRLPAGVEVSGRVVDAGGEPVPGASLALEPLQHGGSSMGQRGTSSADGSFLLADVPDGEYRLIAARSGLAPAAYPGEIRVDGAPVAGLELRLPPGAVIRGRILGFRPEEVRPVEVHAFSEGIGIPLRATMSPGPVYRIDDVSPGEWHVVAQIAPDISVQGMVEVGEGIEEAVLDLELPDGFTLTGRILVDREPLAGAGVGAASRSHESQRGGRTGQDGSFRLERLPPESYVLMVETAPGSVDYRTLEIGGDLDVTVEISTGAVAGRVLRPEGLPVPGASVVLAREIPELETTGPGRGAQSDERGAFEIRQVPAGTYRMTVQAQGFASAESRVVVAPGGTVHLDVALGVFP